MSGHETALLASEELNRRMIEAMPGGVVHVRADGAILQANGEAQRILGLSYDRLTEKYTSDFASLTVWEDGTPCPVSEYPVTRAIVTGQAQPPATIGVRAPDGRTSWAVFTAVPVIDPATGEPSGAVVTFLDVTEQKRIAAELRDSEARFRSIVEYAPNPIALTDREGRVVFLNRLPPGGGMSADDVRGNFAWEAARPQDQAAIRNAILRVVEFGETMSFELTGRSGRRYSAVLGPVRTQDDRISGAVLVGWDVTEVHELQTRLMIADRMAALGTLAAGVAHEINNPLTFVLANLGLLAADPVATRQSEVGDWLTAATEGAHRIRTIVDDLRSFSYVGEGQELALDVRQLLDSAIRMADSEIRHRAVVVKDYEDVPSVLARDSRLGQVFLNLVVNAAQAIPEGGRERNEIRLTTRVEGDAVIVEVSDTGIGIAPTLIDRVFDPFVTSKAKGIGTGLGLYISRNIVTSLGGELTVTSTVGRGTCFRIRLPVGPGLAKPEPDVSVEPGVAQGRTRILVVDDEAVILKVMQAFLRGHDVTVAHSGREAIEVLARHEFDLVFCDLMMPDLGGIDVYEHLVSHSPGSERQIVFMTGGAFTERAANFLRTVPNEILDKPFSGRDIQALVARRFTAE